MTAIALLVLLVACGRGPQCPHVASSGDTQRAQPCKTGPQR